MNHAPPVSSPDAEAAPPDDTVLWIHPVLCELGLPIRTPRGHWHRDAGSASLRMEAPSPDQPLPSGRMLRLNLIHICDAARRANGVSLDLGADASALAERMGAAGKTAELIDQMHRMMASKITVSWGGGPDVPVFDARSRPRGDLPEWRPKIRLSAKFLAALASHAVGLDSRIVRTLGDSPMALDAYAWIRQSLGGAAPDSMPTAGWDELLARFGSPSQNAASFRALFEPALRMVFDADPSIEIAVDDEGVSIRHARGEAEPAPEERPAAGSPEAPPSEPPAPPAPSAAAAPPPAPRAIPPAVAQPAAAPPAAAPAAAAPPAADRITEDSICLPRDATGLSQCLWLRRGHGAEQVLVGVTPGTRLDPERLTILAVEPMILQVSGGLHQGDFDRVSAWIMANRDLIDDFWDDRISTFQEVRLRLRKAPAPGWR
ncbi:replication protein RepA [Roseococcus sp. SYP-B2431]|uniref:replication protein RepA n=1 Tax=Roseococcus sp. SYP-B2431 TaxID=2496640 RepID=UPI0013F43DC3|nr:replication protein RepA [Roseococcus sp. SYP-B2431]